MNSLKQNLWRNEPVIVAILWDDL